MIGLPKLDRIDLNILVQLQTNGQLTNVELASRVGLSPSPCLQRVKRLESAHYISGYGARINLAKLTETITIFTEVTLSDHRRNDFVKFEQSIRSIDELLECHWGSRRRSREPTLMAVRVSVSRKLVDSISGCSASIRMQS